MSSSPIDPTEGSKLTEGSKPTVADKLEARGVSLKATPIATSIANPVPPPVSPSPSRPRSELSADDVKVIVKEFEVAKQFLKGLDYIHSSTNFAVDRLKDAYITGLAYAYLDGYRAALGETVKELKPKE